MLPTNQLFVTQAKLGSLDINEGKILKIISALDINKAYGHDDVSIRTIKTCDESLLKSLFILFKNSLKLSYYPDIWKKSNIIPAHKKNDKQLVNGKIFEKRIFNEIYNVLLKEELLNPSGSCINKLPAITHRIFEAFVCDPPLEVRSVFLDISKTFDKVWHADLLYKLKSMGLSREFYNLLKNYLWGRFQRDNLNG